MTYKQTIDFLFSQLPMYQRIGPAAYKNNLDNTLALSNHCGHPEASFRSIHIAGTNGKGSVAHMLASIFQEQGLNTGLATSPHLVDFRERIKVNGKMISRKYVTDFVTKNRTFFEEIKPSFFEMTIAMTFQYFADQKVDVAVVETGLGGRLDSTNILEPELSIITNIGLDHTHLLGNTLEKIAREKAGIIKKQIPVVIGRKQENIHHVFLSRAGELEAKLMVASDLYKAVNSRFINKDARVLQQVDFMVPKGGRKRIFTDLLGGYQQENLVTALTATDVLKNLWVPLTDEAIERGLSRVMVNTGFKGRWYQVGKRPRVIFDAGHNTDGLHATIKQLMEQDFENLHIVLGMVDDKDIEGLLSLFPAKALYYFCTPNIPRGLDAAVLHSRARLLGLEGKTFPSVYQALKFAKTKAGKKDLVFVGGSTFVVAEVV